MFQIYHWINNNNNYDNVYGAIVITKVIARVHPVHLMNVDWAPGGRQPSDPASRLGLWVRRKLAAIIHIHHRRDGVRELALRYSLKISARFKSLW